MISLLLPFKNCGSTLSEAITSSLDDLGPRDEMVLVDDGSTDEGSALAARFAREDPRVISVTTTGLGIAGALAAGLAHCHGDFVARMDGDDVSLPGRFAAQVALLNADPTLGAVSCRIELFGAPGEGMQRYAEWQNGIVTAAEHARAIFIEAPICHPATMLRRSALDHVGGFRAGPFAEDYDLWLRLVDAGFGIAKVPAVLFRWRIRSQSLTFTDRRYSPEAMRRLRAEFLAKKVDRFAMWGAGPCGKRLARELEAHERWPDFFIDIDPKKIGRTARAKPIVEVAPGLLRAREAGLPIVVAVAARGARDLVRAHLDQAGWTEGSDYFCAA